MRLTCPNCDAQYEVPDEVIPASGRDVQCSNCGQTWYQQHPDHIPDEIEEEDDHGLRDAPPAPDEEVAPPPPPPAPPPAKAPERRQLDPAVADILRQEAEAEFEARKRKDNETLESQPDLGLDVAEEPQRSDEALRRAEDARRRMARMRGETPAKPEPAATAAVATGSRRELLPDIEEINSTLRSDNSPSGLSAETRESLGAGGGVKKNRGFRRGFTTIVMIAAMLTLIYVFAPEIAEILPAAEPTLASYVAWVDDMRLALDAQVADLLTWLDAAATQSTN